MGKLNIAHHKSYHPYRRDNIERVRRDEEEARLKEEREEGRMLLADSEARIDLLRERAGVSEKAEKKKRRNEDDTKHIASTSSMQPAVLPTTNGHINLFEDLELNAIAATLKVGKKPVAETEKGVPLAPSAKDLKPWYSERSKEKPEEVEDDRKKREESRKYAHDPLTSITRQLASRSSSSSSTSRSFRLPHPPRSDTNTDKPPEVQARLSRESSERERALELIRRRKREMAGSATPSTVHGEPSGGYGDVFNRREVEEAHRHRERRWDGGKRRGEDDGRSRHRPDRQW
ncbi:Leukocyte receptor cluster member 1-like protein [Psilocybe cubensis]|uniref:CBF1-interacting co-repressor CIR N-terminal domain-containing protein n=2 Tax=Psilocybe cubensis TaxID=181762 RepID=A0A8H7Y6Q4_PSICU|nr:Leukocyte receptor cluster member 1-like protein [Psilocybe cubensis]KAH9487435.1 Leukocyte receptor cluster member 1-like protein [Psilocybe cubensis]